MRTIASGPTARYRSSCSSRARRDADPWRCSTRQSRSCGNSSATERLGAERARDDHLLHLVGALADRQDLRVAVEAADRVLLDVAVAAVYLHRLLAAAHGEAAGLELGLRRGQREVAAGVLLQRRLVDEQPSSLDL